jgi:hypothetical protein
MQNVKDLPDRASGRLAAKRRPVPKLEFGAAGARLKLK